MPTSGDVSAMSDGRLISVVVGMVRIIGVWVGGGIVNCQSIRRIGGARHQNQMIRVAVACCWLTLTTLSPSTIEVWSLLSSNVHVKSSSLSLRRRYATISNINDNCNDNILDTHRHRSIMHNYKQHQYVLITTSDEETIIVIEQIAIDDIKGLECMSKFCIESFYNNNSNNSEIRSNKIWKDFKLLVLQKLQLLEIFLSSYTTQVNMHIRC